MNDKMLCKRILFLEELYIDSIKTIFFLTLYIVYWKWMRQCCAKNYLFREELYIDSITTIFFLIFSIVFTRYLPAYLTSSHLYLKYTNSSFLSSHKPFPLTSTCTKLKQKKDILSFHFRCFISFHDISLSLLLSGNQIEAFSVFKDRLFLNVWSTLLTFFTANASVD